MTLAALDRFVARFARQYGPLVRYWSAEWKLLHTEPPVIETWPAWRRRQARRPAVAFARWRRRRLVEAARARWYMHPSAGGEVSGGD